MLSALTSMFDKKKDTTSTNVISVRSPDELEELNDVISKGPVAYVFVHADWCGHCQTYKPIWDELSNIPGRTANMAMIHHDMVEKSPVLKDAKIPGYPSVLKVYPNKHIEAYKNETNESTNGMPNIRDLENMKKQILSAVTVTASNMNATNTRNSMVIMNTGNNSSNSNKGSKGSKGSNSNKGSNKNMPILKNSKNVAVPVTNMRSNRNKNTKKHKSNVNIATVFPVSQVTKRNISNGIQNMQGGSLFMALQQALQQMGPTALLATGAAVALPPKKSRGSTKRLTRKSRSNKIRKN
jgi:thiol-disulfide isomerase/thioredoxin